MAGGRGKGALQPGDPRLLVQWTRRYAKSRTIGFLVQWVFIVVIVMAIAMASSLTTIAYEQNQQGLFYLSVLFMMLCIAGLAWFSFSPWGGEIIWRLTQWLYGEEGYASYSADSERATPLWLTGLGGGLVMYHLLLALLVSFRTISMLDMQPLSAIYMAPFLIVMIVRQDLGFWAWIWPVLYALHGVAAAAGAPIVFHGQWQLMNMIVPVFGYGLVAILIGHAYSRYALYRLKSLARSGLPEGEEDGEGEVG
ncbi:MAG: hypothetical protein GC168_01525 [Candidatus Hydrogenedens sp.]|nr:hypothetical protein [Candidatus Hydrogenedens sp.]